MLGKRIRQARIASQLTQRELGDKVGVNAHTVSCWERDEHEPSLRTLREIAASTDRDPGWFLS